MKEAKEERKGWRWGDERKKGGRKCRRQGAMKNEAHWEIRGD